MSDLAALLFFALWAAAMLGFVISAGVIVGECLPWSALWARLLSMATAITGLLVFVFTLVIGREGSVTVISLVVASIALGWRHRISQKTTDRRRRWRATWGRRRNTSRA